MAGLNGGAQWRGAQLKMSTSRPPLGQLPGTKRCGKLWNSRSVSRKTTGCCVASSSSRMKLGLEAIVSKRNCSEPSGAPGPKASLGNGVAWQQARFRVSYSATGRQCSS